MDTESQPIYQPTLPPIWDADPLAALKSAAPASEPVEMSGLGLSGDIIVECKHQRVSYFMKQVGRQPWDGGQRLKLASAKGGDPSEWTLDIRVREYPSTIPAETSQTA